jgi:hypothetical protein
MKKRESELLREVQYVRQKLGDNEYEQTHAILNPNPVKEYVVRGQTTDVKSGDETITIDSTLLVESDTEANLACAIDKGLHKELIHVGNNADFYYPRTGAGHALTFCPSPGMERELLEKQLAEIQAKLATLAPTATAAVQQQSVPLSSK